MKNKDSKTFVPFSPPPPYGANPFGKEISTGEPSRILPPQPGGGEAHGLGLMGIAKDDIG